MKLNHFLTATAFAAALGVTAHSVAEPNYGRIKKDINVMIGIVKSAFENDSPCDSCRVNISGHYLADQGVVFNVDPGTRYLHYASDVSAVVVDGIADIPDMVKGILSEVESELRHNDIDVDFHVPPPAPEPPGHWGAWEVREEMRDLRREQRSLERELREIEIEAIHADDEELEFIREREEELAKDIHELAQAQEEINEKMMAYANKQKLEEEARRAERDAQKADRLAKIEDLVLSTFCDYSSTMRSVPGDEKISIIINRDGKESNIFVFDQSDLEACDSSKTDIRKSALTYAF